MVSAGKVEVFIDANTDRLKRGLRDAARQTERSGRQMESGLAGVGRAATAAGLAVVAIGAAAFSIARTADKFTLLQARIGLYTDSAEQAGSVMRGLADVARQTGVSLTSLGEIYARLGPSQNALNLSQQDMIDLSESIGAAFRVSGASAQEAANATIQLSQAFASGQLRGEELRSVMEQGPRIMQALQRATGATTAELRQMAEAGQLTADVVADALLADLPTLRNELEQLPVNATTGLQNMATGFLELAASVDKTFQISEALGQMFNSLGQGMSDMARGPLNEVREDIAEINGLITDVESAYGEGELIEGLGGRLGRALGGDVVTAMGIDAFGDGAGRIRVAQQYNDVMSSLREELQRLKGAEEELAPAVSTTREATEAGLTADELAAKAARRHAVAVAEKTRALRAAADAAEADPMAAALQARRDSITIAQKAEEGAIAASAAFDRFTIDATRAGEMVTGAIGGAFDKMARGIKVTFRDLAQEILAIFARIAFNNLIAGPVSNFASNLFGGGGGGIGGAIAGALGTTASAAAVAPSAKGGASSQTIINIDAKYASEGTAEMIVSKIQEAAPALIQQSSNVAVQTMNQTQRARSAF